MHLHFDKDLYLKFLVNGSIESSKSVSAKTQILDLVPYHREYKD